MAIRLRFRFPIAALALFLLGFVAIAGTAQPNEAHAETTKHLCGTLPGQGYFSYVKTRGVSCQAGKRIGFRASRKFCNKKHSGCPTFAYPNEAETRYSGKIVYHGWRCKILAAYEWSREHCRKGNMLIHRSSGA